MHEKGPAAPGGQRLDQYRIGYDYSKPQTIKHRQLILEDIADRWVSRGYYPTPSAAMKVLMEGYNANA